MNRFSTPNHDFNSYDSNYICTHLQNPPYSSNIFECVYPYLIENFMCSPCHVLFIKNPIQPKLNHVTGFLRRKKTAHKFKRFNNRIHISHQHPSY